MDKKKLDDIIHLVYNKERKGIIGLFKVESVTEFGWEPEAAIEYQTFNAHNANKLTKLSNEDLFGIIGYGDGYLIKPKSAMLLLCGLSIPITALQFSLQSCRHMCTKDVHNKPRYAFDAGYGKVVIVPMTQKQCDVFIKDVNDDKRPHYIAVKSILKCHEEVLY